MSPNVSYKTDGHTRGNKGVGTTYLAYGFCKMQMYTKTPSFKQYAEINNAKKWIDDKTGDVDMPFVECKDGEDKAFHLFKERLLNYSLKMKLVIKSRT